MKNSRSSLGRYEVLLPWGAALLLYMIFCISGRLYDDWDNYYVAIVVNGLLGNNNLCQYQHPLLCVMMGLVKLVLPAADCFTFSIHVLLIAAIAFMITIFRTRYSGKTQRALLWAAVVYLAWGIEIWNVNYTVWAAFFCFTGMLGLFGDPEEKQGRKIIGTLFFLLGLMLRHQAGLLFLPYIGLEALCEMSVFRGKDSVKKRLSVLRRLLPLLIGIVLILGSRAVFYSIEPWKSGWEYDKARVKVVDFPMRSWDMLEENAASDLDRLLYKGARRWMYADTELVSRENLLRMADAGSMRGFDPDLMGIARGLHYMGKVIWYYPLEVFIPLLFLLFLAGVKCFTERKAWIGLLMTFAGSIVIILFFVMLGRAPSRVWLCVILAAFGTICVMDPTGKEEGDHSEKSGTDAKAFKIIGMSAALLLGISAVVCLICSGRLHRFETVCSAAKGAEEKSFSAVYGTDIRYLVCGWGEEEEEDSVILDNMYGWNRMLKHYMDQAKLPSSEFFRHYLSSGWWCYGQEYYLSLLRELQVENPVRALVEKDEVYLLDMSEDSLFREFFYVYLYDHYGDMLVKKIGTVDEYPVYRFRKEKEEK
ncbi:MAG: hypothetical protein IKR23_07645 [Lachnospiraceae bacterium]|nr:hypothetical protein [Lachnospiraceae bacterium]